jgi:ABC-type nitrate/sulfonate/bicarbonate transport system ATPase subunit
MKPVWSSPATTLHVKGVAAGYLRLVERKTKWARVIEDATFSVPAGRVAVLLGINGSGKTTILNAIAGLRHPESGSILLDDQPVRAGDVGYVFQDYRPTLFPWRNVRDNLLLPLELARVPSKEAAARINDVLEFMRFKPNLAEFPYQLSGGQQQLVAIARTLAGAPKLLLLDEPFSALDAMRHTELQRELSGLLRRVGLTTLVVTHDIQDAVFLGDVVVVLRDGRTERQLIVELPWPRAGEVMDSEKARGYWSALRSWLS